MTALATLGTLGLGAFVLTTVGAIWRWDRQGESGVKFAAVAIAVVAMTAYSLSTYV